jgi:predicted DNA-binding transcriptional regulator YafY
MARSSNTERAQRINAALALMKRKGSLSHAASALAKQFSISKRQAYRYVREAELIGRRIPVPERKVAFTVKLSQGLIRSLRQYARSTGKTLSEIVTQALEVFLQDGRRRG